MNAAFAADAARPDQFEIRLIGQSGRLQRMTGGPAVQMLPGDASQLRIDQRHQPIEGLFIALAPSGEPAADILWTRVRHAGADPNTKKTLPDDPFRSRFADFSQEEVQS